MQQAPMKQVGESTDESISGSHHAERRHDQGVRMPVGSMARRPRSPARVWRYGTASVSRERAPEAAASARPAARTRTYSWAIVASSIIVGAAAFAALAFSVLRLPLVLGYILAGLVIDQRVARDGQHRPASARAKRRR